MKQETYTQEEIYDELAYQLSNIIELFNNQSYGQPNDIKAYYQGRINDIVDILNQFTDYNITLHYLHNGKDTIEKVTALIPKTIFVFKKGRDDNGKTTNN